jgi:hypothetical protein
MPTGLGYQSDPIYTSGDFRIEFWANYEIPLPAIDYQGKLTGVGSELVILTPGAPDDPLPTGSIPVRRTFTNPNEIGIESSFYWPPNPSGPIAGYTAPLEKWIGTTITGLTTQPIVLTGYFSQTYRPGHHNFTEEFLFEPGLEAGISAAILSELQALNIRMIYFHTSGDPSDVIKAIGFDGSLRDL